MGRLTLQLHLIFLCFILPSEGCNIRGSEQGEEADNRKILSNIQRCGGFSDKRRDLNGDDRGVFEPVRRVNVRRHGGLREIQ